MIARSKLLAGTVIGAAFAAGLGLGVALSAALDVGNGDRERERSPRLSYIERLDRELNLTAEQRDSVAAILRRHDATTKQIWQESRQRFDQVRAQLRGDIMNLLNEEQRERYQAFIARSDSIRAARARGERRD